ncbi:hypothetical protein U4E84_06620 [Halorubrum sp. AD140]|uniref:hypothetical protein n=1 Tax=Halorubrum sp. AD140 TaxID=3050073 RepID=UPI002ACCEA15|nr:hypothetical protein [Halorubrum sp. AD140]MDZ5811015.1 hypothetical protein [Halorubrum sp. AD140]
MSHPVTYYCPRCGTLVALDRDGYLADKAVTPYPLEGWTYVAPTEPFEEESGVDGVRFVCGESDGAAWNPRDGVRGMDVDGGSAGDGASAGDRAGAGDGGSGDGDPGCGEPFYLSFVRFEEGIEVDPRTESQPVEIAPDPRPSGPRGPRGPSGVGDADGSDGGFW